MAQHFLLSSASRTFSPETLSERVIIERSTLDIVSRFHPSGDDVVEQFTADQQLTQIH